MIRLSILDSAPLLMAPIKKLTIRASRFQVKTAAKTKETRIDVVEPIIDTTIGISDASEVSVDVSSLDAVREKA